MQEMLKISIKSLQIVLGLRKTREGKPRARKELIIETTVIDLVGRKFRKGAYFVLADQSEIDQRIPIDEVRVSGKRGKNLQGESPNPVGPTGQVCQKRIPIRPKNAIERSEAIRGCRCHTNREGRGDEEGILPLFAKATREENDLISCRSSKNPN